MNKVTLIGRLTRDPNVTYSQNGAEPLAVARYTLAVDRRGRRSSDGQDADFIGCVAFGRQGEFAEKYLRKGMKIAVNGRIQTGSYTNRDGQKVYTTDVVVEDHEFVESKNASSGGGSGYNGNYGGGNSGYNNNGYSGNSGYHGNGYGGGNSGYNNNGGNSSYNNGGNGSHNSNDHYSAGSDQNRRQQEMPAETPQAPGDDFMNIPDGIDEELPFN